MPDRLHLSHSSLDTYWRCPEQYRRRYVCGERVPPGIALGVGKGYHKGAEVNFVQKIDSHEDLCTSDIRDAAVAGFEAAVAEGVMLTDDERSRGESLVIGESKDMTAQLAGVYAKEQAPDYQPVAVEHKVLIPLPAASRDMLCVIDLVDDNDGITDFKTAARKKPQAEADTSGQLSIYACAFAVEHGGRMPSMLRLDVVTKTKVPGRQVLETTRTMKDVEVLARRMEVTLKAIEAGTFPPCPTGSWVCNAKFCGYHATCPYVNAERKAAVEE